MFFLKIPGCKLIDHSKVHIDRLAGTPFRLIGFTYALDAALPRLDNELILLRLVIFYGKM